MLGSVRRGGLLAQDGEAALQRAEMVPLVGLRQAIGVARSGAASKIMLAGSSAFS